MRTIIVRDSSRLVKVQGTRWLPRRFRDRQMVVSWIGGKPVLSFLGSKLSDAQEKEWEMSESFLRKREAMAGPRGSAAMAVDPADSKAFPALVEFLTVDQWPDGTARQTGTVLIFLDQGKVKACLTDRDQDVVLFTTVEALVVALEACEDALRDPKGDWRPRKNTTPRRSGK